MLGQLLLEEFSVPPRCLVIAEPGNQLELLLAASLFDQLLQALKEWEGDGFIFVLEAGVKHELELVVEQFF